MDLVELLSIVRRRWTILLAVLSAVLIISTYSLLNTSPVYTSRQVLLLTAPPPTASSAVPTNPLTSGTDGLNVAAAMILQRALASQETTTDASAHTTISNGSENPELIQQGPYIFIDGAGTDPAAVQRLMAVTSTSIRNAATQLQDEVGARPDGRISLASAVPTLPPTESARSRSKAALAYIAAGIILSLLVTATIDGILVRRAGTR